MTFSILTKVIPFLIIPFLAASAVRAETDQKDQEEPSLSDENTNPFPDDDTIIDED
jgi:hypothetical protein